MDLEKLGNKAGGAIDDRFHAAKYGRSALRKAFPDQWSFFLGELALYSFIILLLTGTYLALFFHPSEHEIIYHGSYAKLDGLSASEAYVSALNISFDVRGGLLAPHGNDSSESKPIPFRITEDVLRNESG